MTRRRALRPPGESDGRAEDYDEQAGTGLLGRYRMRKAGWRKDPTGTGFRCPTASCKTAGDVHDRAHHEGYHTWINDQFDGLDGMWDEHRAEHEHLENEVAELRDRLTAVEAAWETCVRVLGAERAASRQEG